MAFKSYTQCVDRHAYENPDFSLEAVLAGAGILLGNPAVAVFASLTALEEPRTHRRLRDGRGQALSR